ncbi:MAG: hypothetical protein ACYDIC_09665 [Desulfobaccales bacterium]
MNAGQRNVSRNKLQIIQIVVLIMLFLAVATGAWAQVKARDFAEQGQKFLDGGQHLRAAKAFKQALRLEPGLEPAHIGLKKAYEGLTYWKQMQETHRLLHELAADDAVGQYGLGLLYVQKRDMGYAQDEYQILQKLDPALAQRLYQAIYPRK